MFSVLIPTYNNLEYLKICIDSLQKNSKYDHQIIVHINEGNDGTLEYVKDKKLDYTLSTENIGMPKALNRASTKAKFNYIVISHDDFYFCPEWDLVFKNEIDQLNHNFFYLSGIMVNYKKKVDIDNNSIPPVFDAGDSPKNFNENKLLNNLEKIKTFDFQGSTKCPGLVHKEIWERVGGWSEEFSPTGGDDSDFAMKLWNINVRIFKGLGNCPTYHFGSVTTRKKSKTLFTYLGSRGNKIFLKKWKISINFFEKYYLRSGIDKNKKFIFRKYNGPIGEPIKSLNYYWEIFRSKISLTYLILTKF
jgi:glycosyltransferase involved in cell wall biosynthesis